MDVLGTLTRPITLGRRQRFIESYVFSQALRDKLCDELGGERRASLALEGLRTWYVACLRAGGEMLGMPSRAVDGAWHEMILMTREYHSFCDRAFGHYLHHSPDAVAPEPMDDMLARTLDIVESYSPVRGGMAARADIPPLFALDAELGLNDGFAWGTDALARLRDRRRDSGGRGFFDAHTWSGSWWAGCGGGGCGGGGCGGGG